MTPMTASRALLRTARIFASIALLGSSGCSRPDMKPEITVSKDAENRALGVPARVKVQKSLVGPEECSHGWTDSAVTCDSPKESVAITAISVTCTGATCTSVPGRDASLDVMIDATEAGEVTGTVVFTDDTGAVGKEQFHASFVDAPIVVEPVVDGTRHLPKTDIYIWARVGEHEGDVAYDLEQLTLTAHGATSESVPPIAGEIRGAQRRDKITLPAVPGPVQLEYRYGSVVRTETLEVVSDE